MYAPSGLLRGGVPKGRSRTARPSSLSSFWLPDNSFPPSATGCILERDPFEASHRAR